MTAIAKAKARRSHEVAIQAYRDWIKENPDAPRALRISKFDLLVDLAELRRERQTSAH